MGRTLTSLTALAAAAGFLHPDAATAFHFPLGARPRAASHAPAGRSEVRSMPFSGGSVGPLGMTVAPEGLDSLGIAKDAKDVDVDAVDGAEAVTVDSGNSTVAAAVAAPPTPPPEPEVVDESNFTELEKAFAEARRRSLAQAAQAPKKAPKPAPKKEEEAAAGKDKTSVAPSKASAVKTPKAKPDAAAKPAAVAKPKPAAVAPGKVEGAKLRTTGGKKKAPPVVKGKPPREAEVVNIKISTTPKALKEDLEASTTTKTTPKKPAPVKPKAKVEKKKSAPPAETKGGAFSLGAESLEEFFGLTKKPRLVSTTTPPSDDPEPSPMAELDPKAVKSMIDDNGLNEVTLKENFRKMEAEAKAAQLGTSPADADAADVSAEEAKKVAAAAAKSAVALKPNPIVDILSSAFNFDKFDPDDKPGPPIAAKKAQDLRAAGPKAVVERPAVPKAAAPKAAAPKAAAPKAAAPKAAAPKAAAPKADKPKDEGGLAGMLNGMFGAPVYDDEVDTIGKKASESPRAMPVFSPPPAPAKAPAKKAPAPPAPKAAAPATASKKKDTAAAPSFLDGLFGAGEKKAPAPAPAPKAKVAASIPAPSPAPVAKKETAAAPSFLDGLFGGGGGGGEKKAPAPAPALKAKVTPPAPAPAPVAKKQAPASMLDGLFGSGDKKKPAAAAAPPAPAAKKVVPVKKAPPTPAAAKAKAKPAPAPSMFGGMFGGDKKKEAPKAAVAPPPPAPAPVPAPKPAAFNLFGMGGTAAGDTKKKPAAAPAKPAAKAPVKKVVPVAAKAKPAAAVPQKKPPAASSGGGMFDFLGGGAASKKAAPPAPAPAPKPEPVKASSSSPFSSLFGGAGAAGTAAKKKPKRQPAPAPAPEPAPIVSRVKTMDDSFLRKVSVMLKRNQAKIKKFQQLTDRFRGGLIKAPVYYEGVEQLFGEENVEEIIGPLLAALPENDKRKTLQAVYTKAQRAKTGQGEPAGGGIGGLFGGWGSKSKQGGGGGGGGGGKAAAPAANKGSARGAGAGGGAGAAAADPFAFAEAKLSGKDLQLFKSRTTLYSRGGINARNYYDTLAQVFGAKGVSAQLPALLKALPANKRKLLQDVADGLNKK